MKMTALFSNQLFYRKKGFTLIATLSLLVLLALIGIGMLGLSAVSMRQSSATLAREEAKANARLAMMIALGELQKSVGPDQRITAPASLARDNSTSPMNRDRWLSVWHPGAIGANGLLDPAVGWGRSGAALAKSYSDLRSQQVRNWRTSWRLSTLVTNGGNDTRASVSVGSNRNGSQVLVPLQKISSGTANGNGAFGWWVEDLSQLASVAAGRYPLDAANIAANRGLNAMPRVNPGAIRDQAGWTADFLLNSQDRDKVMSKASLSLANGGDLAGLDSAVGLRSWGLFTDATHGGLRADLSRFVESRQPIQGRLPAMSLTGIDESTSILEEPFHRNTGPKWGTIREWFSAAQQLPTGSSQPLAAQIPTRIRPSAGINVNEGWVTDELAETKPLLNPVVVDAGFHWDYTPVDSSYSAIRVHIYPRVVMWNPYNVPLQTSELLMLMNRTNDTRGGLAIQGNGGTNVSVLPGWGFPFKLPGESENNIDSPNFYYFTFTLEPTLFEPGACLVFTPRTPANFQQPYQANVSANVMTARQPIGPNNFFIDKPLTSQKTAEITSMLSNERTVRRYITQFTPTDAWMNWRPLPYMLKARAPGAAATADAPRVLSDRAFPTLQRLYVVDSGTDFTWWAYQPQWNDTAVNNGSAWRPFAEDPYRYPPRRWNFRVRMTRCDEVEEPASKGMAASPAPPYQAATFKDWNPLARTVCRTPSTYYQHFFDNYIGSWFQCVAPYDAHGPGQDWGWFDAATGLARGCPAGDPRNPLNQQTKLFPMIDLPRGGKVLQSIGSLRHVPLSPYPWHPMRIIANSRPSLHSNADRTVRDAIAGEAQPWEKIISTKGTTGFDDLIRAPVSRNEILLYDISYEMNRRLWDKFFASSWSATNNWNGTARLPNQQYVIHPAVKNTQRWLANRDANLSLWLPAYLMANEGAFNVNSLSIDAWAAVLGGLRNAKRTSSTGNPLNGENPFARFDHPSADRNQWNGLLNLTDDQLRTLATRIVDVVRERGPFLGVADFVNRRLATESENTWRNGALDEALNRAALANGPSRGPATRKNGGPATNVAEAFRTKEDHAADFRLDGNPDVIEQGDLLEPLAPSLTARGDSFRIRATGISYFPDGRIASRQTCEVTVVRSPEYLFSSPFDQVGSRTTGNSALEPPMLPLGTTNSQMRPNLNLHPLNTRFGRRFEILDFKWISHNT